MTKNRKKRVCVRLPVDTVLALKNDGRAMTAIIATALFQLVHSIQAGRINNETRQILSGQYRNDGPLISCAFRLDASAVEYLQFNGYCLTSCIKYALSSPIVTQNHQL